MLYNDETEQVTYFLQKLRDAFHDVMGGVDMGRSLFVNVEFSSTHLWCENIFSRVECSESFNGPCDILSFLRYQPPK